VNNLLTSEEKTLHEPSVTHTRAAGLVNEATVLYQSRPDAGDERTRIFPAYQSRGDVEGEPVRQSARDETAVKLSTPFDEQTGHTQRSEEAEDFSEIQAVRTPPHDLDTNPRRYEPSSASLGRRPRAQHQNRSVLWR
jgi:hypothetical protein